ncbi:hypothetical protein [Streptomyces sp. BBFR109]|uniref:hypothetical protein n=1 Tax=Streptomyces sp. BBFR109 TaxID=3448172 RepID=UPI003F75DCFD
MSSLQEHVKRYNNSDSRINARNALLDAITRDVEEVMGKQTWDVDDRGPRLKALAEAYALVVHGKE